MKIGDKIKFDNKGKEVTGTVKEFQNKGGITILELGDGKVVWKRTTQLVKSI